jgi:hypothetical protein
MAAMLSIFPALGDLVDGIEIWKVMSIYPTRILRLCGWGCVPAGLPGMKLGGGQLEIVALQPWLKFLIEACRRPSSSASRSNFQAGLASTAPSINHCASLRSLH